MMRRNLAKVEQNQTKNEETDIKIESKTEGVDEQHGTCTAEKDEKSVPEKIADGEEYCVD